jgi:hypothetical protein
VWEAATAMKAAQVLAMFDAETSTWEAIVPRDSATLHVKDAEDRASQAEMEAMERVSRVEALSRRPPSLGRSCGGASGLGGARELASRPI